MLQVNLPTRAEPLRGVILSKEELHREGKKFAESISLALPGVPGENIFRFFGEDERELRRIYFLLADAARRDERLTPGSEWILDNYHLIEEHVREIRRHLPKSFYRLLPRLAQGYYQAKPRVYGLAFEFLSHRDSGVDVEMLSSFVGGFQSVTKLSIGELWALPAMLRFGLVHNLRILSQRVHDSFADRQRAEEIMDRVLGEQELHGTALLERLTSALQQWPEWASRGGLHVIRRLRSRGLKASIAIHWVEERCREFGVNLEEASIQVQREGAADQISLGNSITSLRTIASLDWRRWFEQMSEVDEVLRADPAQVYSHCDFNTRDSYRHVIERLARRSGKAEVQVAREACALAEGQLAAAHADPEQLYRAHVGYYLVDDGLGDLKQVLGLSSPWVQWYARHRCRLSITWYLGLIIVLTAALATYGMAVGVAGGLPGWLILPCSLLMAFVASDLAVALVHWLATHLVSPRPLPKLDYSEGIPEQSRTVVTIHAIFSDKDSITRIVNSMEVRYIGNEDKNLLFALLADLADADIEQTPRDGALIAHATQLIERLNKKYGRECFLLLFRHRRFNPGEQRWMGWERKRGKIMEFNRLLLHGETGGFQFHVGSLSRLEGVRYVLTLDADSQLPGGLARKLVGVIAHPLNHPIIDELTRTVHRGYSIIQPRIGVSLTSAATSRFSRLFCGQSGLDPYTSLVSDVYQDLFGEASYVGKGIYDPLKFEATLEGRVPDNALLSHDLFESLFARAGLASDIELIDDFPSRYNVYARRLHRWVRGDWQLLRWLGLRTPIAQQGAAAQRSEPSPLSALDRWKIFDNLRRSLVAPSAFLLMLAALTYMPGPAWKWVLLISAIYLFPVVANLASSVMVPPKGVAIGGYTRSLARDLLRNLLRAIFSIICLPHQAYLMAHAVAITLWRTFVSRRHLLEWETAFHAERRLGGSLRHFLLEMSGGLFLTLLALVLASWSAGLAIEAYPLFALWLAAPLIAYYTSKPIERVAYALSPGEQEYLYLAAWQTWSYFRDHLKPDYNFLIPDNLQMVPTPIVAERTSPTNIGLSVLSTLAANDLGFTSIPFSLNYTEKILESLGRLERWKGHFYNWYDIRSLAPLAPRYVSSVDSGNMVGCFMAARRAVQQFLTTPLFSESHVRHARRNLLAFESSPASASAARACLHSLEGAQIGVAGLSRFLSDVHTLLAKLPPLVEPLTFSSSRITRAQAELSDIADLSELFPWVPTVFLLKDLVSKMGTVTPDSDLAHIQRSFTGLHKILDRKAPTLRLLEKILDRLGGLCASDIPADSQYDQIRKCLSDLDREINVSRQEIAALRSKCETVAQRLSQFAEEIALKELYDPVKNAFYIGFNVDHARKDDSHYDLLASEARLASFVAIARNEVAQKHWFQLGRALAQSAGGKALLSWSGTMFEYLMPLLIMHDYGSTLLSETYRAVVKAQRSYGRKLGIPWGVSESGYSGVDFHKTYQYHAFGVPGLGFKRGLGEDIVISPYSTFLALSIDTPECLRNLRRLDQEGGRGEYGFYEAIDYSPQRLTKDERSHVVKSFLAHHQGMSLVALDNLLKQGVFRDRFHADPRIKAIDHLLHERFPEQVPAVEPHQAEQSAEADTEDGRAAREEILRTAFTTVPRTRVLSNGRLSLMADNSGGGYLYHRNGIAVTRWRSDVLGGSYGTFVYCRDVDTPRFWSVGYAPTRVDPDSYEVAFNPDRIEYRRKDGNVVTRMSLTVSPEEDVEIRQVELSNTSNRLRRIEVTSYGEVSLTSPAADAAHPAFAKMFVQSEFLPELDALIFTRRPRSKSEKPLFLLHMVVMPICWAQTQFESSRAAFIGRGRTVARPLSLAHGRSLSGSVGPVLDPIFSLRTRLDLDPGTTHSVMFVTAVAESREQVMHLAQRYHDLASIERAFTMAWSHSNVEQRHQQFTLAQAHAFQHLANAILFDIPRLRGATELIASNRLTQSGLWRFGVSGDEPIVLLRVSEPHHIEAARELLLAHEYLRLRGVVFDLIILDEYPGGYLQNFHEELEFLIRSGPSAPWAERRGGIYLRSLQQLSEEETRLLQAIARVVLDGARGSLASQLSLDQESAEPAKRKRRDPATDVMLTGSVTFDGWRGLEADSRAVVLRVRPDSLPPLPWSNVLANPNFGCIVTERGGGYTWSQNSRENRITPWSNDPVTDPPGEILFLRDVEHGVAWTPTPTFLGGSRQYSVMHGFGFSRFGSVHQQLESVLTITVSPTDPVKWWHLSLKNLSQEARTIELYLYLELVLGVLREQGARSVVTDFDRTRQLFIAQNFYNNEFAGRTVVVGSSLELSSYTGSRVEFVGRNREPLDPIFLEERTTASQLSKKVGAAIDPAAVLATSVNLQPGETRELVFFLADEANQHTALEKGSQYRAIGAYTQAMREVEALWEGILGRISVQTPDVHFDGMVNGWLLYQTVACRLWGRSAFYQSGGAIGFRDQLQDSLALLPIAPRMTRAQILIHAARQFLEGDVQHWWHPPTGRGVRTRISDDLLWLPFSVARYLEITGDRAILDEQVGFLEGALLEEGHAESYFVPRESNHRASIYEHCIITIDRSLVEGPHRLPLIGCGDWNDGMNEVGIQGRGESVWLAWFLIDIINKFLPFVIERRDLHRAQQYESARDRLRAAIETHAWDGRWYRRGFFDDGTPFGSAQNDECQIDSLAQSWGVLSGEAPRDRAAVAMQSAYDRLVDTKGAFIRLLDPPFDSGSLNPGYIKGYLPGIRENGGQYTHAAAWVIMAAARLQHSERALELFSLINPLRICSTPEGLQRYKGEPYVVCGDVYSNPTLHGHAGWSWYSGSAGWLYQVAVHEILGLKVYPTGLALHPCIPDAWPGFRLRYQHEDGVTQFTVERTRGQAELLVNGEAFTEAIIPFPKGGQTLQVTVRCPLSSPSTKSGSH